MENAKDMAALSEDERADLRRRLSAVLNIVGRWRNLLDWCADVEIRETVERLEKAVGIAAGNERRTQK